MGKLFNLIKKDYEELKEYDNLSKMDFMSSRRYNVVLKAYNNFLVIRSLLAAIDNNTQLLFENEADYIKILNDNIQEGTSKLPYYIVGEGHPLPDYEKIINKIEEALTDEQIKIVTQKYEEIKDSFFAPVTHPFDEKIKEIKDEIDSFNNDEMSEAEKEEIKNNLDFTNQALIKKNDGGYLDNVIDIASKSRDDEASKHLNEFIDDNNINLDNLSEKEKNKTLFNVIPNNQEKSNMFKPFLDKIVIKPDFIEKIKGLDKLVSDNKILNSIIAGETGLKEYAFDDWFKSARDIKDALYNYTISNGDKASKIANLRNINNLAKDLKDKTNKYNEVLKYIKNNFDLNKSSLPLNVYSGRAGMNQNDLELYSPDLPEFFDYENAPYGAILNCYSQVKALCVKGNITIEEFLNNPAKAYLNICNDETSKIDEKYALPKQNNSLGKRIATILVEPLSAYSVTYSYTVASRTLELVTKLTDLDENTNNNMIISRLSSTYTPLFDHSGSNLFNNVDNLKNLFALGDKKDNLLKLSNKYLDKDLNYIDSKEEYNQKINNMSNINPVFECNRMINVLIDYFNTRKELYNNPNLLSNNLDEYNDEINPGLIFVAAKEYFSDYLYKNNIDINIIQNEEDRKMLIEFATNPVLSFERYLGHDDPFIHKFNKNEDIDEYKMQFAIEFRKLHKKDIENFIQEFTINNNEENGFNKGKNIDRILEDNKGGIWERYLARSTSPEYKSLVQAIEKSKNPHSPLYGDMEPVKFYAKKYLDYKLQNKNFNDLSKTGKKRVEFCKTILKSLNAYDEEKLNDLNHTVIVNEPLIDIDEPSFTNINNITINEPLNDIKGPSISNIEDGKDVQFHNKIKEKIEENIEVDFENVNDDKLNDISISKK